MLCRKDRSANARIAIDYLQVTSGIGMRPCRQYRLKYRRREIRSGSFRNGPVDAAIKCGKQIIHRKMTVQEFLIQAITKGSDDVGKVHITVSYEASTLLWFLSQYRYCSSICRGIYRRY